LLELPEFLFAAITRDGPEKRADCDELFIPAVRLGGAEAIEVLLKVKLPDPHPHLVRQLAAAMDLAEKG